MKIAISVLLAVSTAACAGPDVRLVEIGPRPTTQLQGAELVFEEVDPGRVESRDFTAHYEELRTRLVVSMGPQQTTGYTIRITQVLKAGGSLHVYVVETLAGSGCRVEPTITWPAHAVVIPRSEAAIRYHVWTAKQKACRPDPIDPDE